MSNPITVRINVDTTQAESAIARLTQSVKNMLNSLSLSQIRRALGLTADAEPARVAGAVVKVVSDLGAARRCIDNQEHEIRAYRVLHSRAVDQRDEAQAVIARLQDVISARTGVVGDPERLPSVVEMLFGQRDDALREIEARQYHEKLAHEHLDKMEAPRVTALGTPMLVGGRLLAVRIFLRKVAEGMQEHLRWGRALIQTHEAAEKALNAAGVPNEIRAEGRAPEGLSLARRVEMLAEARDEYQKMFEDLKRTSWPDESVKQFQDQIAAQKQDLAIVRSERDRLREVEPQLGELERDLGRVKADRDKFMRSSAEWQGRVEVLLARIEQLKEYNLARLRERDEAVEQVTLAHEALNKTGLPGYVQRECPPPRGRPLAERIRIRMEERDQLQQDLHEALRLRDEARNVRDASFRHLDDTRRAEREECAKLVDAAIVKFGPVIRLVLKRLADQIRNRVRYVIGVDYSERNNSYEVCVLAQRQPDGTVTVLGQWEGRWPAQMARDWLEAQQKDGKLPEGRAEVLRNVEFKPGRPA